MEGLNCPDHPLAPHQRSADLISLPSRFPQVPKLLCTSVAARHSPASNKVKCHLIFSPLIAAWPFHQSPSTHALPPSPFHRSDIPHSSPPRFRECDWQQPKLEYVCPEVIHKQTRKVSALLLERIKRIVQTMCI